MHSFKTSNVRRNIFKTHSNEYPKGVLVAAHGEAYEHQILTVKAHHMFWIRQFQHFAAAPTHRRI